MATTKPPFPDYSTFCTRFNLGGASAVNTGAAAIELAPAVTGKKMWITQWVVTNKTAGQYPVAQLVEDSTGTPVIKAFGCPVAPTAAAVGEFTRDFNPPIQITAGKNIGYSIQSVTGNCNSIVRGWLED